MKRMLCAAIVVTSFLISGRVEAQAVNDMFSKGDNILGLGVGLAGTYNYGGGGEGTGSSFKQSPSYILTYEHASIDPGGSIAIGFGGYISYLSSSLSWTDGPYSYSDNYSFEFLMARASFHYKVRYSAKVDPYAGLTIGYVLDQHNLVTGDPGVSHVGDPGYSAYSASPPSPLGYGAYLGARYYFTDKFGIWAELVIMNNAYNYIGFGINLKM
jgi:hypothetical protein